MCSGFCDPVSLRGVATPIDEVPVAVNDFPEAQSIGLGARFAERPGTVRRLARLCNRSRSIPRRLSLGGFLAEGIAYTGVRRSTCEMVPKNCV